MMSRDILHYAVIMLAGVFISSLAQVMLKKTAVEKHESFLKEYLNAKVISAYLIFFVATILGVYGYKVVPLSMGNILDATGYIWVTVFSVTIFKEKLSLKKIIALILILSGIVVYSVL